MRFKLALLGAIVSIFLLGCGSNDSTSASSQPLTKKEFVKRANSICKRGVKKKDQIIEAGFKKISSKGQEPAKEDLEEVVLDVLPPLRQTTDRLDELSPPVDDERAVRDLLQEYEQALDKAEERPSTALTADFLQAPNEKARTYGLTSCSL